MAYEKLESTFRKKDDELRPEDQPFTQWDPNANGPGKGALVPKLWDAAAYMATHPAVHANSQQPTQDPASDIAPAVPKGPVATAPLGGGGPISGKSILDLVMGATGSAQPSTASPAPVNPQIQQYLQQKYGFGDGMGVDALKTAQEQDKRNAIAQAASSQLNQATDYIQRASAPGQGREVRQIANPTVNNAANLEQLRKGAIEDEAFADQQEGKQTALAAARRAADPTSSESVMMRNALRKVGFNVGDSASATAMQRGIPKEIMDAAMKKYEADTGLTKEREHEGAETGRTKLNITKDLALEKMKMENFPGVGPGLQMTKKMTPEEAGKWREHLSTATSVVQDLNRYAKLMQDTTGWDRTGRMTGPTKGEMDRIRSAVLPKLNHLQNIGRLSDVDYNKILSKMFPEGGVLSNDSRVLSAVQSLRDAVAGDLEKAKNANEIAGDLKGSMSQVAGMGGGPAAPQPVEHQGKQYVQRDGKWFVAE